MRLLCRLLVLLFVHRAAFAVGSAPPVQARAFNYAQALQGSLYFYEAQQSGRLSPNNRVPWRGDSRLTDGQEIGRDLSGGLYDAGDHWKANLTMGFTGQTLAWSGLESTQAYARIGQLDELTETLCHINDYFLRCVLNPDAPATELEIVIGVGGRQGVPAPMVHDMWAPAEVAHLLVNNPVFAAAPPEAPGADIAGSMASSLAAGSMVLRLPETARALRGKRGYEDAGLAARADLWLRVAEKLTDYADLHRGPPLAEDLTKEEKARIRKTRSLALRRSDGRLVEIAYRAVPIDQVFTALTWVQRARLAQDPRAPRSWEERADRLYRGDYRAEALDQPWNDYGHHNSGKLGSYNMTLLRPRSPDYHHELQLFAHAYLHHRRSPGGLIFREWDAHQWGSLRHANNNGAIVLHYASRIGFAPPLAGNLWWKSEYKSDAEFAERMVAAAKSQVDYALGANPYGRSYLVGFGHRPFNHPHHRGAYGAWAGFHHFMADKPEYRPERCRHLLVGGLLGGPDHNDAFVTGPENRRAEERDDGKGGREWIDLYRLPGREGWVDAREYRITSEEPVRQLVKDARFNEVAIDYNAGFTANLARLVALGQGTGGPLPDEEFPPREPRDENLDPITTDREFFVVGRSLPGGKGATGLELTVFNRSRWPARVARDLSFRVHFTLEPGVSPADVRVELGEGPDHGAVLGAVKAGARPGEACVEVAFPGRVVFPGDRGREHDLRRVALRLSAPAWATDNDWSLADLSEPAGEKVLARIPVYEAGVCVGGEAPPGGFQTGL